MTTKRTDINSVAAFPHLRTYRLLTLCVLTLLCALFLGGGTHAGFLGDAIAQFAAIPLLLFAILRCFSRTSGQVPWGELILCLAILAVPLLQLVVLPPSIWINLPFRADIADTFRLTGQEQVWLPLSVMPEATALAALSLLPPLALFLAARQLNAQHRRYLVAIILLFSGISVFLGLAQIADGPQSSLRFFEVTNPTEAVGFFANRNHFSALLYVSLPLAASLAIDAGLTLFEVHARNRLDISQFITLVASLTLMFLLGSAQIMARSRAGATLTIVAMIGVAALILVDRRNHARRFSLQLFAGAIIIVLLFTAQFGLNRFAERLVNIDPINDTRLVFARNTLEAARAYFPFGSGLDTFPTVYAMFEKPEDLLINGFANHAHNDFLELWMESGVPGAAILAIAIMWLVWQSLRTWARPDRRILPIDQLVARAATISIGLLLLHSLVDYPLHTAALMAVLAICGALVTEPYPEQEVFLAPDHALPARMRDRDREIPRLLQISARPPAPKVSIDWPEEHQPEKINWPGPGDV